jgi:dipeptidase
MCDTLVSLTQHNRHQRVILAKNSDREPDEAQQLLYIPSQKPNEDYLRCTYISIPQASNTHGMILSKPFQMWGAEMGVNEHGLAIGNEALFTKKRAAKTNTGLSGMDMLRLALERCTTAGEAVQLITRLLETYGQDACGGYRNKDFFYSNSFLIADPTESYVLETSGKDWVYKKVEEFYSISNGITLEHEFDTASQGIQELASAYTGKKRREGFSFRRQQSDFLYTTLSFCRTRQKTSFNALEASRGSFDIEKAMNLLRSHHGDDSKEKPTKAGPRNLCMHASGILNPSSTTGSMIAELSETPIVWLTGCPYPCISLYKPFFFHESSSLCDQRYLPRAKSDRTPWWQIHSIHEKAKAGYPRFLAKAIPERNKLQHELLQLGHSSKSPIEIEHAAIEIENVWISFLKGLSG